MRFKADENLPKEVADLLSAEGNEATTVAEQGLIGIPDGALATRLQEEQRCLVTLDLHFADIRTYPPEAYDGIIVLCTKHPDKQRILRMVQQLLPLLRSEAMAAELWIVRGGQVRVSRGRAVWP